MEKGVGRRKDGTKKKGGWGRRNKRKGGESKKIRGKKRESDEIRINEPRSVNLEFPFA